MVLIDKKLKMVIKEQIKLGKSLSEISRITSVKKTTIYYYMRKILGRKFFPIKLNLRSKELIGEIIGLFAGDGYYANYKKAWDRRIKIFFNATELGLADYYAGSFFRLTHKRPRPFRSGSVIIIQMHSKALCDFILSYVSFSGKKSKTVQLKDKSLLKNRAFVKGFLRALVDSDGYIRKDRKEIYYGSISINLFLDFLKGLDLFHIAYKTYVQKSKYEDFYKVRLSGKDRDIFIKVVSPIKSHT